MRDFSSIERSWESQTLSRYEREQDEAEAYEAALEAETLRQRELLEAATVSILLEQHDTLVCKLSDITTGAPRSDGRVTIDLDSLVYALAEQLATVVLAEPPDVDPPDDYEPDTDRDCDYWSGLK